MKLGRPTAHLAGESLRKRDPAAPGPVEMKDRVPHLAHAFDSRPTRRVDGDQRFSPSPSFVGEVGRIGVTHPRLLFEEFCGVPHKIGRVYDHSKSKDYLSKVRPTWFVRVTPSGNAARSASVANDFEIGRETGRMASFKNEI